MFTRSAIKETGYAGRSEHCRPIDSLRRRWVGTQTIRRINMGNMELSDDSAHFHTVAFYAPNIWRVLKHFRMRFLLSWRLHLTLTRFLCCGETGQNESQHTTRHESDMKMGQFLFVDSILPNPKTRVYETFETTKRNVIIHTHTYTHPWDAAS